MFSSLSMEPDRVGMTFIDDAKKSDTLELCLRNHDLHFFDAHYLHLDTDSIIQVTWGYPGFTTSRRMVIKKIQGFETLTITGRALSALLNQVTKTRGWKALTRSDVVRQIAHEHGYGEAAQIEDSVEVIDYINQARETDAHFLTRLAQREGFLFYVDDTGFHWHRKDKAGAPTHTFFWRGKGSGNVLSASINSDWQSRPIRVRLKGKNPKTGEEFEVEAGPETESDRDTLGERMGLIDGEHGRLTRGTQASSAMARKFLTRAREVGVRDEDAKKLASEILQAGLKAEDNTTLEKIDAHAGDVLARARGVRVEEAALASGKSRDEASKLAREAVLKEHARYESAGLNEAPNTPTSEDITSAPTREQAQRQAEATYRRAEDGIQWTLSVIGDPSIRAKTIVKLLGVGERFEGNHYVEEVRHTMQGGSYTCTLRLVRDATGKRARSIGPQPAKKQGGRLNDQNGPDAPSRREDTPNTPFRKLTIDRETGQASVQWSNDKPSGSPGSSSQRLFGVDPTSIPGS